MNMANLTDAISVSADPDYSAEAPSEEPSTPLLRKRLFIALLDMIFNGVS